MKTRIRDRIGLIVCYFLNPVQIAEEVNQDVQHVNIELLIGMKCTRALESVEVIPSRHNGPNAMITVLDCDIVGPVTFND